MTPLESPIDERAFKIGDWTVEPERHLLVQGGTERRVEPKVMQVLLQLAGTPGRTVSRQALLDAVWGDVVVVDRVVNRTIWELRRAFDDDARAPRYIETIPKGGYRLLAEVAPLAAPEAVKAGRGPWRSAAASAWILAPLGVAFVAALAWTRHDAAPKPAAPPEVRPLTSRHGWEYDPALSPDGRQLAFVAQDRESGSWDLYRMTLEADGTPGPWHCVSAEPGAEGHAVWSPDGSRIAYYRHGSEETTLHVRTLGGEEERLLEVRASYPELDWSPDGSRLAFRQDVRAGGPRAIYEIELESGTTRQLTQPPPAWRGDATPRFSPDGRRLAFVRSRGEGLDDLYVLEDAEVPRRLTHDGMPIGGIAWQDRDHLIYSSRRAGAPDLWRLGVDGAGLPAERLGLSGWQPGSPSVRGGRLVFVNWAGDTNLWRIPLADKQEIPDEQDAPILIAESTQWDLHPAISPDGRTMAFSSNRSGHYEIWTADVDGGPARQQTRFEGPFTGTPRWSPDGLRLVFDSRPDGHADLFEVDLETRELRRLTTRESDEQAGFYLPGGDGLVFASNQGGRWQVRRRTADGAERVVTTDGGFAPQASPDGRWLYYLKPAQPGLWRSSPDGTDEVRVLEDLTLAEAGAWCVADSGIYRVEHGTGREPDVVVLVDPDSGLRRVVHVATRGVPYYDASLAVAPGEAWFVLGQKDRPDSDLYLW